MYIGTSIVNIIVNNVDDISGIVSALEKIDSFVDIKCGNITVDGKSAQGIYTLPLGVRWSIHSDKEHRNEVIKSVEKFIVH